MARFKALAVEALEVEWTSSGNDRTLRKPVQFADADDDRSLVARLQNLGFVHEEQEEMVAAFTTVIDLPVAGSLHDISGDLIALHDKGRIPSGGRLLAKTGEVPKKPIASVVPEIKIIPAKDAPFTRRAVTSRGSTWFLEVLQGSHCAVEVQNADGLVFAPNNPANSVLDDSEVWRDITRKDGTRAARSSVKLLTCLSLISTVTVHSAPVVRAEGNTPAQPEVQPRPPSWLPRRTVGLQGCPPAPVCRRPSGVQLWCANTADPEATACTTDTYAGQCYAGHCIQEKEWAQYCGYNAGAHLSDTRPATEGDALVYAKGDVRYARLEHRKALLTVARELIRCIEYPGAERPLPVLHRWDGTDDLDSTTKETP